MSAPCPALGFRVRIELPSDSSAAGRARILASLSALLAANGLEESSDVRVGEVAVRREGAQATDADRALVAAWAAANDLATVTIGPIVDLSDA